MRDTPAFEYFEVRPCIERDRQVTSYRDENEFIDELASAQKRGKDFRAFWSLYGVDRSCTMAIGDFVSKDAAHEVMNAILAVPAAARDVINSDNSARRQNNADCAKAAQVAAARLDDMINQSSNDQRILPPRLALSPTRLSTLRLAGLSHFWAAFPALDRGKPHVTPE